MLKVQKVIEYLQNCGINWRHLFAEIVVLSLMLLTLVHFIDLYYSNKQQQTEANLNKQINAVNTDLSNKLKAESGLLSNINTGTASVTNVYNITKNTIASDKKHADDNLQQLTTLWNSER